MTGANPIGKSARLLRGYEDVEPHLTPGIGENSDQDDLDQNVGLNLARAYSVAMHRLETRLAPLSLTPKAASVLWRVDDHPGISQSDLARFFQINRASIYTVCSSLIERGLLHQGQGNGDRRRRGLRVTEAGHRALADAKVIIGEHEEWLCRGMKQSQIVQTIQALKLICTAPYRF